MFVARAIDGMAGGVERMVTTIMNALDERGHSVDLLTWDEAGAKSFYPMAKGITWHRLGMGHPAVKAGVGLKVRRANVVRGIVRSQRPDIIVCFQDGPYLSVRAYTAGMGVPVVAAERNAPTRFDHTRAGRRRALTYHAFRFARRVLIQFDSFRDAYPAYLHHRMVTVPNPVATAPCAARPAEPDESGRFRLLCVGRLGYQKNQRALVDAFARLVPAYPDWDLVMIGEGEDRAVLERRVEQAGLAGRVSLPGTTEDLSRWYCSSHLFCLPSRWEGFPNALAEALAHGLPAVGYADCAGVRDLLESCVNGNVAEGNGDVPSLASALEPLMACAEQRREFGAMGPVSLREYAPEHIFTLWEHTLRDAISS